MFHADNLFEFFYLRNFANKEIDVSRIIQVEKDVLKTIFQFQ